MHRQAKRKPAKATTHHQKRPRWHSEILFLQQAPRPLATNSWQARPASIRRADIFRRDAFGRGRKKPNGNVRLPGRQLGRFSQTHHPLLFGILLCSLSKTQIRRRLTFDSSGHPKTRSFNNHQSMGSFRYHNRPLLKTTGQVSLSNKTEFKTTLINLTK